MCPFGGIGGEFRTKNLNQVHTIVGPSTPLLSMYFVQKLEEKTLSITAHTSHLKKDSCNRIVVIRVKLPVLKAYVLDTISRRTGCTGIAVMRMHFSNTPCGGAEPSSFTD